MSVSRGDEEVKSEPNVVPLCDILLVLLIIFMVVTPLVKKGVDVRLPTALNMIDDIPDPLGNAFWVNVIGERFFPRIRHGSKVLCAKIVKFNNGDLVALYYEDRIHIKRYTDKGEAIMFSPELIHDSKVLTLKKADMVANEINIYKIYWIVSEP